MERRTLGKTGLEVSRLGLGGFHLLEIEQKSVKLVVERFLEEGGNYFETAHSYGDGQSEKKLGEILPKDGIVVATKTGARDAAGAERELVESLKNLQRDHVDILFFHAVTTPQDWERITAPGGALEAFERAKAEGWISHVGITSHGYPGALLQALKDYPFDLLMTGFNFYDRFNFPEIEQQVLPLARSRGMGVLAMKALADGYLWRSEQDAFRYVNGLDVDAIVTGINDEQQLGRDLEWISLPPMSAKEKESLYSESIELGDYVCRQCGKCLPCPKGIDIPGIFLLEGRYDRQMEDGRMRSVPDHAVRQRFAHWFQNEGVARKAYEQLRIDASACDECGVCTPRCPYGIDIPRKLRIVHSKMENGVAW